jgi:hypothetical protein
MNPRILLLALALAPAMAEAGEESIKLNPALESYRSAYVSAKLHKAFAQAPDGTWFWVQDRTSPTIAINDSLEGCIRGLKGGATGCVIINIDDKWMP